MSASYEIIDHTADIGLHVFGNDPADLFRNAARALTDVITDRQHVATVDTIGVSVEGHDWPDLMVNWLRELLYLWSGKELLIASIVVDRINPQRIDAVAGVEPFRPDRHRIRNEIKAVTYHQIDVSKGLTGWEATIILDV